MDTGKPRASRQQDDTFDLQTIAKEERSSFFATICIFGEDSYQNRRRLQIRFTNGELSLAQIGVIEQPSWSGRTI